MVSQQMLISVALPVAAMAIVVGSVANVQDSTLAPGLDTLDAATQFGYPDVTIEEENELRGITVFNMLSAQNCLYSTMAFKRDGELTQEDEDFMEELEGDYQSLEKVDAERTEDTFNGGEGLKTPYELGHGEFTYYNHGDVLRDAMELEGFNGACLGGKQISLTAPLREHYEFADKALSAVETAGTVLRPWTWQVGEGADNEELNRGALQGRYGRIEFEMEDTVLIDDPRLMGIKFPEATVDSGAGADNAPDFIRGRRAAAFFPEGYLRGDAAGAWDEDPGALDKTYWGVKMLGGGAAAYAGGAAGAAIGSTIGIYAIAGTSIGGPVGTIAGAAIGAIAAGYAYLKTTDHVEGMFEIGPHPAVLLGIDQPIGITDTGIWTGTGIYEYRNEKDNVDWREDLNAFRVRMVNVPIVMDPTFFPDEARSRNKASLQMGYNYITTRANYVICNQSEGFIQSNAGEEIEYDGKKKYQNDPPVFRDVVYPRIELSKRDATCLSDAHFGSSTGYNIVKEIKTHQEFLDGNGDFRGPISSSLGVYAGVPIREMKEEGGSQWINKTTIEDALVLSPDKRANLVQGIERVYVSEDLDMDWWDRPRGGVYQTTFGVSDDQCDDDTYDVTKMFTDNKNEIGAAMSENVQDMVDFDETSYEIDGDEVTLFSDKGYRRIMPEYSFERFSDDSRISSQFEIQIDDDGNYDNIDHGLGSPARFFVFLSGSEKSKEGDHFLELDFGPEKVSVSEKVREDVEDGVEYVGSDEKKEESYDESSAQPAEGYFRLVIDQENSVLKLQRESGSAWDTVIEKELSDDGGDWSVTGMKVRSHIYSEDGDEEIMRTMYSGAGSIEDPPKAELTLKEVKVNGKIAGCT